MRTSAPDRLSRDRIGGQRAVSEFELFRVAGIPSQKLGRTYLSAKQTCSHPRGRTALQVRPNYRWLRFRPRVGPMVPTRNHRETTMKFRILATIGALALVTGAASVSASTERKGELHLTKECSQYTRLAGSFCTFTSSNLAEIKVGSKVFYDQADGIPSGLLDSNVVLDAGTGNRAVGRCTLDDTTNLGLCTFSDGTGHFSGFHARVKVDCRSICRWDGTYSFSSMDDR
jgi:hypothetical protein